VRYSYQRHTRREEHWLVDEGADYKVKRITVHADKRLKELEIIVLRHELCDDQSDRANHNPQDPFHERKALESKHGLR
jgi:hypothetical protein